MTAFTARCTSSTALRKRTCSPRGSSGIAGPCSRSVTTAALWNQPEADYSGPSETGSGQPPSSEAHSEWWDLSRDAQHLHLAAQRFARVKVAEMRLEMPEAVRSGKEAHNIYRSLKSRIDAARERQKYEDFR